VRHGDGSSIYIRRKGGEENFLPLPTGEGEEKERRLISFLYSLACPHQREEKKTTSLLFIIKGGKGGRGGKGTGGTSNSGARLFLSPAFDMMGEKGEEKRTLYLSLLPQGKGGGKGEGENARRTRAIVLFNFDPEGGGKKRATLFFLLAEKRREKREREVGKHPSNFTPGRQGEGDGRSMLPHIATGEGRGEGESNQ